jgi:hypothetical protein
VFQSDRILILAGMEEQHVWESEDEESNVTGEATVMLYRTSPTVQSPEPCNVQSH